MQMLRSELESRLESYQKQLLSNLDDIGKLDRLIDGLNKQREILKSLGKDLNWKIEDVKEQLEDMEDNE